MINKTAHGLAHRRVQRNIARITSAKTSRAREWYAYNTGVYTGRDRWTRKASHAKSNTEAYGKKTEKLITGRKKGH